MQNILRKSPKQPDRDLLFSNRNLKLLIIPLFVEQVLTITVGMADSMMVSSAGETAISGVSLVDMINKLIINIFAALATGGAVVSAQLLGAQKREKACDSAGQLLIVSLLISVLIAFIALLLRYEILRLFFGNIEEKVMQNAVTYFWISTLTYPFIAIYNACAALFRSMGNSKVSMLISIVMNLINVIGNAVFIFVFQLGVAGAAWSTLISRVIGAVLMIVLLTNPQLVIHLRFDKGLIPDFSMIRQILRIGIPSSMENSFFQLGRVLVVSIISMFGTVQIAANAVANTMDSFGCIVGQTLNLVIIAVVGRCIGAGEIEQAKFFTKKLLKITYLATICLNTALLLSLPLILMLYGSLSKETVELATLLIWIHNGCAMLLWPAAFTLPNALRAANDVRYTMIISIFSMALFRIVFSYILGYWLGLGAIGVWVAMLLDWSFRSICFILRFVGGKWLKNKVTE